jgi:hypothetical protein
VLFDKICRRNAITHRLTQPASPTTTGKIERFHLTLRRELLDDHEPFTSLQDAQAAVDRFVDQYNADRPHQALDDDEPVTPADRFTPVPADERELLELWLPPTVVPAPAGGPEQPDKALPVPQPWAAGEAVEFDKVVPASGNMWVARRQLWLGPARAGQVVRFWASTEVIHLSIAGARVKSVHSHLTVNDLAKLVADGAVNAGPPPIPTLAEGQAVEVDRVVAPGGTICLGGKTLVAAALLAGRRVGIRVEPATLLFFDLDTRELLRTRPNPLTPEQIVRLHGLRPAGPPPRPALEPIRVQRLADRSGTVSICGQRVGVGRAYAHRTLTAVVSDTTLAIELDDGDTHIVRRTNTRAVTILKARPPRSAPSVS